MNFAACDFELYWDEDETDPCSVAIIGTDSYICHPKAECYQAAIVTSTGMEWVGHPSEAPFDEISGDDWEWCAQNASFDERVHYWLKKWGKLKPHAGPRLWNCTADLCAFSAAPRALAAACAYLYGEKVSKDYRSKAKGVQFRTLSPERQAEVREAGLIDSRISLRFWTDLSAKWPEHERRISRLTRQQSWRGLRLDVPRIERGIKHLQLICWAAENMLPWNGSQTMLSYQLLCEECRKEGIEAPPEINKNSDACAAWEEKYGERFKWVDSMRQLRSANGFLKKLQTMLARVNPETGRMGTQNKYFGAHTGRWGDGDEGNKSSERNKGFNSRNLPQREVFGDEWLNGKINKDGTRDAPAGKNFAHLFPNGIEGVNLRYCIIPEEGHHFVIPDLRQIEPRVLWHFAGDKKSLDLVRQGMSPYEAHGRTTMGYDKPEPMEIGDPDGYRLGKARVIACGYQVGFEKFLLMAPTYISEADCERIFGADVPPADWAAFEKYLGKYGTIIQKARWATGDDKLKRSFVNSWKVVADFRRTNPLIASKDKRHPGFWKWLDGWLKKAIGEDLEIPLPSGRNLVYRNVALVDGQVTGVIMKFGRPARVNLYGGKVAENICQAVARDIFAAGLLRLDDAGHWVPLHSHDEACCEVPVSVPPDEIKTIMAQAPEWMADLPVESSCKVAMHYCK